MSGYATFLFELGGLANQRLVSHFCYSSYTTPFALAKHPLVNGWDKDVIAEDHHMFAKCFFASIWEAFDKTSDEVAPPLESQVRVRPVFLPAMSYMVDCGQNNTVAGWFDSCCARFTQARRHAQGVAELSYVLLQYARLAAAAGFWKLPFRTHSQILAIAGKMASVHIFNQVHSFTLVMVTISMVSQVLRWGLAGGLTMLLSDVAAKGAWAALTPQFYGESSWCVQVLFAIFGPLPPLGILTTWVCYAIIRDASEGRLTEATPARADSKQSDLVPVAPDVQGSVLAAPGTKVGDLGFRARLRMVLSIYADQFNFAELTCLWHGLVPIILAAWSLLFHGTHFEYVVAAKPS